MRGPCVRHAFGIQACKFLGFPQVPSKLTLAALADPT